MNDQNFSFDPEDPRLTAYALGELHDPADRAAIEQTLQSSPEARAALREIRAFTALLTAEYEQERAAADEPSNIIALPPRWPRRLLLMAAAVLLFASGVWLVMPHVGRNGAVFAVTGKLSPRPSVAAALKQVVIDLPKSPSAIGGDASRVAPVGELAAQGQAAEHEAAASSGLVADRLSLAGTVPAAAEVSTPPAVMGPPPFTGSLAMTAPAAAPSYAFAKKAAASPSFQPNVFTGRDVTSDQTRRLASGDRARLIAQSGVVGGVPRAEVLKAEAAPSDPDFVSSKNTQAASSQVVADEDASRSANSFKNFAIRRKLPPGGFDTAAYEHLTENPFLAAKDNPLSTFSVDVDTASYANVRRFIESGSLPPPDAVRVEELVNYFPYSYAPPAPDDQAHPFAVHLEAASCPWNPQDRLVRIGIKARELARDKRPASNLVFLIDVSGSMEPPERLPLIKAAMRMLVEQLSENDRVAIVTYAGESGVALPSTTGDQKETILRALDKLEAGGSTNGASGIKLAYKVAREGFIQGGTNRVILATDGDFNVGVTSQGGLVHLIEDEAKSGVFLSALGVGTDNYKDATMQKLADKGNGNYAYIDKLDEARKVLVEQMSGTLVTVAKDVKIQVEFNPATVAAYRLVGYEKRMLRKEDFNDDRIDAGEIGAGHRVTALYEVVPIGGSVPGTAPAVDALKYGPQPPAPVVDDSQHRPMPSTGEMLTVKMRHKAPEGDKSERSYEESLTDHPAPGDFANASPDFKFAAAVASFGLVLRDSPYKGSATLGAAIELAQDGKGADPGEYRAGFIELARKAQAIQQTRGE